jgi:signal transduction histidine kinase
MMSLASAQSANHSPSSQPSRVERLVQVVQEVSAARFLEGVQEIVRSAARELTGADGATFVLRDGDQCHYADEDAIAPLWKGKRFPMIACISGWAMMNRQSVVIPDIFEDPRIPISVYRATFVKSMAMMPIRAADPVGAIGVYWASPHHASGEEMQLLEALADTTAVALENVRLYSQLNARIDDLQRVNHELERFTWVSFHDFQEPLRMIATHSELLERAGGEQLNERRLQSLHHVREGERRLRQLTTALAEYVDIRERGGTNAPIDMVTVVQQALGELAPELLTSDAEVQVGELPVPIASATYLRRLFVHLIGNAIKFRRPGVTPRISITGVEHEGEWRYSVADNGVGLDEAHRDKVFGFFERLHPQDQFQGSGLGLTICRKIVDTLGGRISVESEPARGSTFTFTIPRPLLIEEPVHGS